MSKHTPWPWRVINGVSCRRVESECGSPVTIIYNHQEYNGEPCGSITSQDKSEEELAANANLIAAAPELLAVLKSVTSMSQCEEGTVKGTTSAKYWFSQSTMNEINAVIEKATGGK